ncbi:MAG: metal ABC transporter permease [Candidatus Paralactobacillus gallistercoris]|uniref:Metal ABC transporter permease n=1 Tax=Candidatus Paralactobacillus gallistercoris TaxID=2838724 RepID=A0A948TJN6_9LACO|nr:metal ABC transporter permease [Candidatus Paralactobacillus gallistercoris]
MYLFAFEYMRNAYLAGTFIAITCGIIGVFVIARNMAFLAHTLAEIGFAGAAFGLFVGLTSLQGMLLFTILSALFVGQLGDIANSTSQRESSISAVSGIFIGMGILFLSLANKNASSATNILFGSVIGISIHDVVQLICLSIIVLITITCIYRKLIFDSYDRIGARAQGLSKHWLSLLFLLLLAISVSISAQIVGSLLVFILLTLPSSTAKYLGRTVPQMLIIAVLCALIGVWLGLYLGYLTNLPVTFFIALIEFILYFTALLYYQHQH